MGKKKRDKEKLPHLALVFIMKDEAHVIESMFDSVKSYIDYYVAVDTGSTDNSIEVVKNYMAKHNIPGEVHFREWRQDFGWARTEALKLCVGKAEYCFMMDCDDLLHGKPNFKHLKADGYSLKIGNQFSYWRTQLFRCDAGWVYKDELHEYAHCEGKANAKVERLGGNFYIESRRLGSRNKQGNKYLRDAEILKTALEKDPNNTRKRFYLAQSYFDAGLYDLAIKEYTNRFEAGGWIEECYYSAYRIGIAMKRLDYPTEEIAAMLEKGTKKCPLRAECIYEEILLYRDLNRWEEAYQLSKEATKIKFPVQFNLFLIQPIYDYLVLYERAIAGYYSGHYQDSLTCCKLLSAKEDVPDHIMARIEHCKKMVERKLNV